MNALFSIANPLPKILLTPFDGPTRRRCINGFQLNPAEVDRFNVLLARIGGRALDTDQLASAGRELSRPGPAEAAPPCIRQRLRWIAAVEQMLADRQWQPANDAVDTASAIVDYARSRDDLIPDWLPQVGRMDDAIVVETAWPQLSAEVDDYLDYVRVRGEQARQRDRSVDGYAFSRTDWEEVRHEQAVLAQYEKRIRESSFLPGTSPLFRVH
ncbi:YkvA family protein [Lysobacter arvi]|uniref:YkvA family protein n=1 Tax=Lysobacter arvi TaxID=3038776 RepID=A0ABU1CBX4_9GAMM|nr:YkvA family protein [Lysobacter arvi]MDR0182667.1 YkvA family protein [Lysobacter arvi]